MKLSMHSICIERKYPLLDAIRRAADLGYDGYEIDIGDFGSTGLGLHWPEEYTEDHVAAAAEAARTAGIEISSLCLGVLWRFENDAIGIIDGGANQPSNYGGETSVFFTEGGVRMDRTGGFRIYRSMKEYHPSVEEVRHFGRIGDDTDLATSPFTPGGHLGEIEHFIDCVVNDKEPLTPGEHGRYALECAWAAIKSFQTNQPVTLPLEKPYPSY